MNAATINAIWDGPLDHVELKKALYNVSYNIGDITTDELPPILPVFSILTHRGGKERYQHTKRSMLIEHEEQQREELV